MRAKVRRVLISATVIAVLLVVWWFGLHKGLFWQRTLAEQKAEIRALQTEVGDLQRHEIEFEQTALELDRQTEQLRKLMAENQELRQTIARLQQDEAEGARIEK